MVGYVIIKLINLLLSYNFAIWMRIKQSNIELISLIKTDQNIFDLSLSHTHIFLLYKNRELHADKLPRFIIHLRINERIILAREITKGLRGIKNCRLYLLSVSICIYVYPYNE